MKSKFFFLASALAISSPAFSDVTFEDGFFQIAEVTVTEINQSLEVANKHSNDSFVPCEDCANLGDLGDAESLDELDALDAKLDKIINMGKKIWKIVEAGKPVVSTQWAMADAMPEGKIRWDAMSGWKDPIAKSYRISAKNLYGISVVDFTYRLTYTYGGSYKGVGRYLTRVSGMASDLSVLWGYTFDAVVEVPNVTNAGTVENPVAALEMIVKWRMSTVLKSNEGSASYLMRGDGTFQAL